MQLDAKQKLYNNFQRPQKVHAKIAQRPWKDRAKTK